MTRILFLAFVFLLTSVAFAADYGFVQTEDKSYNSLLENEVNGIIARSKSLNRQDIHWFQAPIVFSKSDVLSRNEYVSKRVNLIADVIPLDDQIYAPSLDRVSQMYERYLFDPYLLDTGSLNETEARALSKSLSSVFSKKINPLTGFPDFTPGFQRTFAYWASTSSAEPQISGDSLGVRLVNLLDSFAVWATNSQSHAEDMNTILTMWSKTNADRIRSAKEKYQLSLDPIGLVRSEIVPEPRSWFSSTGWRTIMRVQDQSICLRVVAIRRPWFDLKIMQLAKMRTQKLLDFHVRYLSDEELLQGQAIVVPTALLLSSQGKTCGEAENVGIVAVLASTLSIID